MYKNNLSEINKNKLIFIFHFMCVSVWCTFVLYHIMLHMSQTINKQLIYAIQYMATRISCCPYKHHVTMLHTMPLKLRASTMCLTSIMNNAPSGPDHHTIICIDDLYESMICFSCCSSDLDHKFIICPSYTHLSINGGDGDM